MAKKLLTAYTFTPGAANAGTVVVSGIYALEQFLLITNVTTGATIYQFNKATKGGAVSTGGGNTTLTLEADTSAMSGSDRLQVFVDDGLNVQVTLTNASVEISNDVGNPVPVSGTVTATGPLTDAQLRASAVLVSAASLPLPTGAATAANQSTANTSLANLDADLGAQADAAATSDTGTFGVIALIKRGLQNWTTLLGRVPSLTVSSTRLLVDGSGVTQPVSGPLTDTQLRATAVNVAPNITRGSGVADANTQRVTLASDGPAVTALTNIDGKTPALVSGRQPVDGSGVTQPISAANLPLPTGAATETTLNSVNTKLPSLVSGSLPVLVQNGQLEVTNDVGNPLPVGTAAQLAVSGSASALSGDLISQACGNYRSVAFQITGTWVGTITFQVSNDNTNWVSIAARLSSDLSGPFVATASANNAWLVMLGGFQYFRLRFTAYTSGTASASAYFNQESVPVIAAPPASLALTAGTSAVGDVGVQYRTTATGAASSVSVLSPATPAAATIKATAGRLLGFMLQNSATSLRSVKIFNVAAPTLGTTAAAFEIDVAAGATVSIQLPGGIAFATAMTYSVTSAKGLTDNTSTGLAANDVSGFFAFA